MTLVQFYLNGSVHNSDVLYFSERDVGTSSLVLCLILGHVYSHGIHTKHEYNYNIHTLHNEIGVVVLLLTLYHHYVHVH